MQTLNIVVELDDLDNYPAEDLIGKLVPLVDVARWLKWNYSTARRAVGDQDLPTFHVPGDRRLMIKAQHIHYLNTPVQLSGHDG